LSRGCLLLGFSLLHGDICKHNTLPAGHLDLVNIIIDAVAAAIILANILIIALNINITVLIFNFWTMFILNRFNNIF
jgi:hypothetical protein